MNPSNPPVGVERALALDVVALLGGEGDHGLESTHDRLVHLGSGDTDGVVRRRPAVRVGPFTVVEDDAAHEFSIRLGHVLRPNLDWVVNVGIAIEDRVIIGTPLHQACSLPR